MSGSEQFDKVLVSLAKNPLQRNGQDIQHIKAHLRTIQFLNSQFQDDDQNFEQLSKLFRLEIFEKGSIIFHIDTRGDKYYLILKGQVEIYARPPKKVLTKEEKLKEKQEKAKAKLKAAQERKAKKSASTTPRGAAGSTQNLSLGNNSSSATGAPASSQMGPAAGINGSNKQKNNDDSDQDEKKVDCEPEETEEQKALQGLIMVKLLLEGWAFGEMALLYNQPRLASAVAAQRVTLAVLTKHNFTTIMRKAQMKLIQAELDVLRGSYLFSSWEDATLRDIYLNSEMNHIRCDQNVFKQGDEADSIYIIKKGLFQMSKTITVNQSSDVEINAQSFYYEGNINQLSERDVFGEEDFVDVIRSAFNMGLADGDSNRGGGSNTGQAISKQAESTLAMKLQEEFKSKGRKILRESTVVCKNREGGFVIKIKIYDFLSRVLVFRATRLTALASIEQKRSLHKEIHEKNTQTVSSCHLFFKQADTKKHFRLTPEDTFRCTTRVVQPTSQFLSSSNQRTTSAGTTTKHYRSTLPSQEQLNPNNFPSQILIPVVASTAADATSHPVQKEQVPSFFQQQVQLNQQQVKLVPLSPRHHCLQNINVEDEDVILKQLKFDPDSLDQEGEKSARKTHKLKPIPPQPNEKELMTPFKFDTARLERYKISKRQRKKSDQNQTYELLRMFLNDHPRSHSQNSNAYPSPRQQSQNRHGNSTSLSTVIGGATAGRIHSTQSISYQNSSSNSNNYCSSQQSQAHSHLESLIERRIKKLGYSILNQSPEKQGSIAPFSNKKLISKMGLPSYQNSSRIDPRMRRDVINISTPIQSEEQAQNQKLAVSSTVNMNNSEFEKQGVQHKEIIPFKSQQSTQPTFNENAGTTGARSYSQSTVLSPPSVSAAETLTYTGQLSSKPQNVMEYMPKCGFKGQILRKTPLFESGDIEFMKQKGISDFKTVVLSRRKTQENSTSRKRILSQTGTPDSRTPSSIQTQYASKNQQHQQQQQQIHHYLNNSDIQINPSTNLLITKNTMQSSLKPFLRQPYIHPHFV